MRIGKITSYAEHRHGRKVARIAQSTALLLLLFLAGCASVPPRTGRAPDWVLSPPLGDARYEYFVGAASNEKGDTARAEEQATYALMSEIVRFLGVRITANTSAEARSSLSEFQSQVIQQVTQQGEARIQGFRVVDRWVRQQGDLKTVYILGRYDRQDLLAEQKRVAALFHEKIEAIAGPERDGDQLLAVGSVYRAVEKYIEAAAAAVSSPVENANIRFQRAINKARDALSRLTLQKLNDNLSGTVGRPFAEDFLAKVETSRAGALMPVSNMPLEVSYKTLRTNGKIGVEIAQVRTDSHGIARFTHPIPGLVGSYSVNMRVDLSAALRTLDGVPAKDQSAVESLRQIVAQKRLGFSYTVGSRAKEFPTSVVILDTDIAGNPTGEQEAASGLEQSLTQAGFTIPTLTFDAARLKGKTDAEIISALKSAVNGADATRRVADATRRVADATRRVADATRRVAYGSIAIEQFSEGDGYIVKVGGTVKVADLQTGKLLYTRTMSTRSRGDNAGSAIAAAFRSIGQSFGQDIARALP